MNDGKDARVPSLPSGLPAVSTKRGELLRWARLARKELRETLRDRRTIVTLVVMPLVLYPLVTIAFQTYLLSNAPRPDRIVYHLGFVSPEDRAIFLNLLNVAAQFEPYVPEEEPRVEQANALLPNSTEPVKEAIGRLYLTEDVEDAVQGINVDVGVRRGESSPQLDESSKTIEIDWEFIVREGNPRGRKGVDFLKRRLSLANQAMLQARLQSHGDLQRVMPVQSKTITVKSEEEEAAIPLAAVLPLILLMMTITGAVYPAIDLTAGERERGTLEVLMAAPVPRVRLLLAKYSAVLTVALLTASVNLLMLLITLRLSGLGKTLLGSQGLTGSTMVALALSLFLFAAFFSAVLLAVTSFAQSFKEAQAHLIPLTLAALVPGVASMLPGIQLKLGLAVVPLLNISLLVRDLLNGAVKPSIMAVVILSTLLYAISAIALAARVFGSDQMLYDTETRWRDFWRRRRTPIDAPTLSGAMGCISLIFPLFILANGGIAQSSLQAPWRLFCAAVALLIVFGLFPLLAAWMGNVTLRKAFAWRGASLLGFLAAILFGLSLWPLCHELVVATNLLGFETVDRSILERGAVTVMRLRKMPPWLVIGALVLVPAIAEEFFFRGYFYRTLEPRLSAARTILVTAVLFGLFHVVSAQGILVERLFPSLLMGLALGWVRYRTGSIFPPMLLHACHNGLVVFLSFRSDFLSKIQLLTVDSAHLPLSWCAAAVLVCVGAVIVMERSRPTPMPTECT
ncbi:CAAX amino terminal protease self- immunity [Planctomycetes bacterium Pan216]|uniref:CAAX amino terminal protease self-immunity n=1 Tax=Kolteria novifilia TaxID=2527975 RepID=A0A518BBI5_9BACT|nr:CAAX amino terminal protease self- immunity [Planctomycetes bacterium Pan216]